MDKYFIAIYTNVVKAYCELEFFSNLAKIVPSNSIVSIVDNSDDDGIYLNRVREICHNYGITANLHSLRVDEAKDRFQYNVLRSVNYLRAEFLKTDCTHFFIIETDVIPPIGSLELLSSTMDVNIQYGAIGALYYGGIHSFDNYGLVEEDVVFSGCTTYRRDVLERLEFRIDITNINCFPDSNMKFDIISLGLKVGNVHRIHCKHVKEQMGFGYNDNFGIK